MKRQNKDGRPIYSITTWNRLLDTGKKLEGLGYVENPGKPNLFSRVVDKGYLYADLQGTEIVPNWDSTCPYLYFYPTQGTSISDDEKRTILKSEFLRLKDNGCPARFSFYDVCEPDGLFVGDDEVSNHCPDEAREL